MKKIIIAGGTGFIGKYLTEKFKKEGFTVIIISRAHGDISWNEPEKIASALENAELLINLSGKSVDCRYNEKNKAAIFNSRTETTRILGEVILSCNNPPKLWINSSTATIYRHAEDRAMTEKNGEIGTGFSVEVAKKWEKTFFDFHLPKTRQVALRMAIVLGKDGGVLKPFTNLVRFGLGGIQGNGRQMFSWIHIEDVFDIIKFIMAHENIEGVYNCAAPNPIPNHQFMKTLRNLMHIPFGFPSPKWLLEIGARLIQTETELILKSRWVIPEKLLQEGYIFKYPDIESALKNILDKI